ncbi:O-succinylbenzoate-CoA ligase [Tamaricihabitans halophyticus]|uniref:O-succinylbenzoate-CoA ligase n=1 Tax=Tamaricihabitans halophyticus TaxID=1262583 RepID=A0A4R2QWA2_9PSEU|nr:long-chain-fatty-acid--CoA ligase [Tamaricihabitans halophyticus]TCP53198.1 O-succinylbenzoate-CoA ligase [Tamaricihabitans halophyticus]
MSGRPNGIADLVDYWNATDPDAVAVQYGPRTWSWAELADRVHRAAGALSAAGVGPGDRVASYDKNHPASLEITLACARIGSANAMVNFRLAPEEVAYTINDAQATVLFVGAEFLPVVEELGDQLTTVREIVVIGGATDQYEDLLAAAEPLTEIRPHRPDDSFLQLYTSGTTGFPKGAMLTYGGMLAHSVTNVEHAGIVEGNVALVAMPLFHVGGSSWAILALYGGASIVVVRELVPEQLLDEIVRRKVTHGFLVPAVFSVLLNVPGVADRDYSAVRELCYGASPMPLPLLRQCLETFPFGFRQVYGMTEACGVVTTLSPEDHRDERQRHRLVSAGTPIPGVEIAIGDPSTGEHLPAGSVGEVLVRSAQLMSGYWGNPAATAQALPEDGWLRSGDAGKLDADGYLYITDRIKDMIISGGENVYPAEIERVLAEHPAVLDVAVIGVPDERWGETPKAIVVGKEIDVEELLAYCRERLAAFKCPKSITVLSELPRNPTGKVLKRELRRPYWEGVERGA